MPNLTSLRLYFLDYKLEFDEIFQVICEVAIVAASQGKDVVVHELNYYTRKKFKIMRKNTDNTNTQISNFKISLDYEHETKMFENILQFVRNKMQNYYGVVTDCE